MTKKILKSNLDLNTGFNTNIDNFSSDHNFENSCYGGLSNTPLTYSNKDKNNICIDYLTIRFNGVFKPTDYKWGPLLNALMVDSKVFDDDLKTGCYEKTYIFDANIYIMTGGDYTKNDLGEETTILDLKGQACREFEGREGNWIKLFEEILKLNGKCKRIDIALDNFSNTISINSLYDKVAKKLYSCDWKNTPEIVKSHDNGFSITFGKHSDKTLCIYNKVAERKERGYAVLKTDWIRYESRFKQESGENAFSIVYCALVDNSFDICAKQLLKGLIDFKKGNKPLEDNHNINRLETWDKWNQLLNVDERIKIKNQFKLETSLIKKVNWFNRSASKNRILTELYTRSLFKEIQGHFIYDHIEKLTNREIANLNYALQENDKEPLTLKEAKELLYEKYSQYQNISLEAKALLGLYDKETGELF